MGVGNLNFNFSSKDISCVGHLISCKVSHIKNPKGLFWWEVCIIFLQLGKVECLDFMFDKMEIQWRFLSSTCVLKH